MNACEQRSGASAPAVTLMTSFFDMPQSVRAKGGPDRLGGSYPRRPLCPWEHPVSSLEIFFDSLLVLIAIATIWFAIFSVMKLYQGQR
ncbi:hypothetical protein GCM10023235_43160 [Kitasatospora terrestris]|uniref:Uncharacterized protein n=1 Tax=Kitasatospora terrestris TaxID=258051 RepID=A0ABP9DWS9_9ACTN